jgi:hypothetical protein
VISEEKEAFFSNFRLAFVKACLVISFLTVIFTESLSFFNRIAYVYVFSLWAVTFLATSAIFIFTIKKKRYSWKEAHFDSIAIFFRRLGLTEKIIIYSTTALVLALLLVACTLNNNYDSFTYHLPKVEHWIQNGNLEFFPTINTRLLYLAPLEEYVILQLRLLSGNALFVNFVQFFSYLGCLMLASLIAKLFGSKYQEQIVSIAFAATIPMGMLEATSTQTDMVVAFFLMALVYFGMLVSLEKKFLKESLFFFCLSFSLGILAKATFYVFAFPFCLAFGIYFIRLFRQKALLIMLFAATIFLALNGPFLDRNFRQFGSVLGPKKTDSYYLANLNDRFGLKETMSNVVKNIALQLALPGYDWNGKVDQAVAGFHSFIDFPLNDVSTSWEGIGYSTPFMFYYDIASNFQHTALILIAIAIIYINSEKFSKPVKAYVFLIICGFLFFSFLLKWQPWQNRLDLALYLLAAPFLAIAISSFKRRWISDGVSIILLAVSIYMIFVYNPDKPILGKNSIFLRSNVSYAFYYGETEKVRAKLEENHITDVGLMMGQNSVQWQNWLIIKNTRFEEIYFHKDFLNTPNYHKDFQYQAIIIDGSLHRLPKLNRLVPEHDNVQEITRFGNVVLIILKQPQNTAVLQEPGDGS